MDPPPLSTINWARNCSLSSELLAAGLPELEQATLELVIGHMNSTLPDNTVYPTKAQLMSWHFSMFSNPVSNNICAINQTPIQPVSWYSSMHDDPTQINNYTVAIINDVLINCRFEFCNALDWQGYPDLAGQGMIDTLIIEAALTTAYLSTLGGKSAGFFWRGEGSRLKHSFQETAVLTWMQR